MKTKRISFLMLAILVLFTGVASAQDAILNMIAGKVVQRYQQATCEQLWQKKGQPKSPEEQEAIQKLRANPRLREEFINRIAAPIANKMFECGMIP